MVVLEAGLQGQETRASGDVLQYCLLPEHELVHLRVLALLGSLERIEPLGRAFLNQVHGCLTSLPEFADHLEVVRGDGACRGRRALIYIYNLDLEFDLGWA